MQGSDSLNRQNIKPFFFHVVVQQKISPRELPMPMGVL